MAALGLCLSLCGCMAVGAVVNLGGLVLGGPAQYAGTAYSAAKYSYELAANGLTPPEVLQRDMALALAAAGYGEDEYSGTRAGLDMLGQGRLTLAYQGPERPRLRLADRRPRRLHFIGDPLPGDRLHRYRPVLASATGRGSVTGPLAWRDADEGLRVALLGDGLDGGLDDGLGDGLGGGLNRSGREVRRAVRPPVQRAVEPARHLATHAAPEAPAPLARPAQAVLHDGGQGSGQRTLADAVAAKTLAAAVDHAATPGAESHAAGPGLGLRLPASPRP